nr:phosphatase PAP2 family protein [uncultured Desulfuromonas sp.]
MIRQFYLRQLTVPLVVLSGLFYLFDACDWDLLCSDMFYIPEQGGWIYKHSWWANELLHDGGRNLIVVIAATCLLLFALSFSRQDEWRRFRRTSGYLLLCIALGTGLTAIGKKVTHRHCPKEYQRYGGSFAYRPILAMADQDSTASPSRSQGRCFPAGHASGAFSLIGLYFVSGHHKRARALTGLAFSLILGALFTFGQLVRGAHFISHSIATLMVCWTIAVLFAPLVLEHHESEAQQSEVV